MIDQIPSDDAERRHKLKMAHRKAVQDAEVASKTIVEKGLLMVNTGPGKGKSTGGFRTGAAGRSVMAGRWASFSSSRAPGDTGERRLLEGSGLVRWFSMGEGFTWETQDRARDVAAAAAAWAKAEDLMADPTLRLLVLDELNVAPALRLPATGRGRGDPAGAAARRCTSW